MSSSSSLAFDGGTKVMRAWGLAMAVSSRNSSTLPRPFWYRPSNSMLTLVPVG